MVIKSVRVRNFRSVMDETLDCERLTVLVGANGTGKSAFLRALELFYSSAPKLDQEDFYARDTTREIEVAVTFSELSDEARKRFAAYMQGGILTVERVFRWSENRASHSYHGSRLQNDGFQAVRQAGSAKDKKAAYEKLRAAEPYSDLPAWSKQDNAEQALWSWETAHPDDCTWQRDDGRFFGFTEVAEGYLGRHTRFLFVPAVRDASSDAADSKGSILTELMDLVVRSTLAKRQEILKLKEDTQAEYRRIMDPAKLSELQGLQGKLEGTLRSFVPDAGVSLAWLPLDDVDIPLPKALVRLVEDGYPSVVARTGHGLQRAFIMTLLQHLALVEATPSGPGGAVGETEGQVAAMPDLVLVIEEPELYQHPNRQRHMAGVLHRLAAGRIPGVAERTQVLYATHSPLFVGIDRVDQIRLLRKQEGDSKMPKTTKIARTSLDDVAGKLWEVDGSQGPKYTSATLAPRLAALMTPWMNEGFFADVAVLVEGEDDRAAVLGVAKALGHDLESEGISVIPCGGKSSLDRPFLIFRNLGIPVYAVWDSDKDVRDARPEDNRRLLRLCGCAECDWPGMVEDTFACFEHKLETTLEGEMGRQDFDRWLRDCQEKYGLRKREQALKNPTVIGEVVALAFKENKKSSSLESIVDKVRALRRPSSGTQAGSASG
jgi:predicted ATPase